MTLAPGVRLGPYEILAPLGAGGMGEVYRAKDPRLSREVAIKVLPQALANDSERLAGLLEQAGYQKSSADSVPDVIVFNTCAVRENADNRLYGSLGNLLRDRLPAAVMAVRSNTTRADFALTAPMALAKLSANASVPEERAVP